MERVVIIAAMTLCGRIGHGGVGSLLDRRFLEQARAATDASLLGAASLRQDDPEMRGPDGRLLAGRQRAVISASGEVPVQGKRLFRKAPRPLIFTSAAVAPFLAGRAGDLAEVVALPEAAEGLCLAAALEELGRRGVRSLLIEGGGGLNYSALAQGVVDELLLTVAPRISGSRGTASLADGPQALGSPFVHLELVSCEPCRQTGELFCRYRILR